MRLEMQAALEMFQAQEFNELVGAKSSVCVEGLDEATISDRETSLKLAAAAIDSASTAETAGGADGAAEASEAQGGEGSVASAAQLLCRLLPNSFLFLFFTTVVLHTIS